MFVLVYSVVVLRPLKGKMKPVIVSYDISIWPEKDIGKSVNNINGHNAFHFY